MNRTVHEQAREIQVLDEVDVLVAGGGVSGCAAAVSAARAGARTILVERNGCLGGVATASLMANIGNLYLTLSGKQDVYGFAGEVIEKMIEIGAASPGWRHREVPGFVIDSERFKTLLIEMAEDAGVTILTHVLAVRPIMDGSAICGVYIESKSGRQAILAKTVVDATGEADLAFQAGAECSFTTGTASTLFKLANVDLERFVRRADEIPDGFPELRDMTRDLESFDRNWRERGILFFPHGGGTVWPPVQDAIKAGEFSKTMGPAFDLDALGMYALKGNGAVVINSNFYKIEDLDIRNLSAFELHAQKMCYYVAEFMRRSIPGFENSYVAHIGTDLGIRVSRSIRANGSLRKEHTNDATEPYRVDDVVGISPVRAKGEEGFFRDFSHDIPFRVLVPTGCENLLVGSAKSIATDPPAIIRGMTRCMMCGQAAGAASAIAARTGTSSAKVPIRDLQTELLAQNVNLGDESRLGELGLDTRR